MAFGKKKEIDVESILPDIEKEALSIERIDASFRTKGKRIIIDLGDRAIQLIYYAAPKKGNHAQSGTKAPLIAGFHGGGFLYGGCSLEDAMWMNVAEALDVNVASIGFRQSPCYNGYDTLSDALDSTIYLRDHASEFGFDPDHISVMGCSSGGTLAATAALAAQHTKEIVYDNQILLYPIINMYERAEEKGPGSFSGPMLNVMFDLHCSHSEAKDPFMSPWFATENLLKGLPKAIIVYCDDDCFRHEDIKYIKKLKEAGVEVASMHAVDMPHTYFENGFVKIPKQHRELLGKNADKIIESGQIFQTAKDTLEFIKCEMVR